MHCMLMDLLHGFEVLSTTEETLFNSRNASYLVRQSELGAKSLNKICLKIVQKVLKWPLQYANFQKISGEACP